MPYGTSALSPHILFSQFRGPRILNDANASAEAEAAVKADAEAKAAADAKAKEEAAKKADPNSPEGRISNLVSERDKEREARLAAEKRLKEIDDAKKAEEDDKLKKKGEFEKLLTERDSSLAAEKKAREDLEARVKAYEDHAQGQIKQSLESITDAEKRKSAEAMLAGLSTDEQMKRLPDILKLVGQTSPGFGAQTPASQVDQASKDQKKARYQELLSKPSKTPKETQEMHALMPEVTKMWEEEQAKNKAS